MCCHTHHICLTLRRQTSTCFAFFKTPRGITFNSDEAVNQHLVQFFANKDKSFYERWIIKLTERWQKIIEQNGQSLISVFYINKWPLKNIEKKRHDFSDNSYNSNSYSYLFAIFFYNSLYSFYRTSHNSESRYTPRILGRRFALITVYKNSWW